MRRTSTLPSRSKKNRGDDADPGQPTAVTTAVSVLGGTGRRTRSCVDCRDPEAVLSHSAPDLFTISIAAAAAVAADRQQTVRTDSRCENATRLCLGGHHRPYELYSDCIGDRVDVGQLRPMMDTPV